MKLPREAWWVAGLMVLTFLLLLLLTGGEAERGRPAGPPVRTSYSSEPGGLRALYLALDRLGYDARRLGTPFLPGTLPERGTLLVVEPMTLANSEWRALRNWVAEGHALLLAGEDSLPNSETVFPIPQPDFETLFPEAALTYARPDQPTYLALGLARLAVRSRTRITPPAVVGRVRDLPTLAVPKPARGMAGDLGSAAPLFRDEKGTVVAYAQIGKGSVILLTSPWSLSNQGIEKEGNFAFVLNALEHGPVYFDEYHHGYGENLLWRLLPLPLKLAAAQALLGLLVVMYARSRRFGPIIPLDEGRRERSEYLGTMTGLLQKGRAAHLALQTAYDAAMARLRFELGLPHDAAPAEVARAAGRVDAAAGEKLAAALEQSHRALEPARVGEARAISLVQQLDEAVQSVRQL
jgi:hypothetical protein